MRTSGHLVQLVPQPALPKCQANARDRRLETRRKDLLPTRYAYVVFTLPRQLSPLAYSGAEIGFFSVLHT